MKIGYKFSFNAALYNRTYAKNIVDSKTLEVTITAEVIESFNATLLKTHIDKFKSYANGAIFVRVDDPTMIDILEPKSGNTVHNRLNELKRKLTDTYDVEIIGTTTPPETRNGYRAFVMGSKYNVTMEGLALYMLRYFDLDVINQIVTVTDGVIVVTLDNEDLDRTKLLI